jgi:hypothetical protein
MGILDLVVGNGSLPPLLGKGSWEDGRGKQSEESRVCFSHKVKEE